MTWNATQAVHAPKLELPALTGDIREMRIALSVTLGAEALAVNGELAAYMQGVMTIPFNIASRCPVLSVPS